MVNGENSVFVLINLNDSRDRLLKEKMELQKRNQELQKNYFELLRIEDTP